MQLLIIYRKQNRATWIPLLAALEDADLLARIEWRLIGPGKAAEEFEAAHEGGEAVVLAMTIKTPDMPWASETARQLAPLKRPGDLILAGGPHPTARPIGNGGVKCGTVEQRPTLNEKHPIRRGIERTSTAGVESEHGWVNVVGLFNGLLCRAERGSLFRF